MMKSEKLLWILVLLFYGFGIPGILLFPDFFLPFSSFSLILGAVYLLQTITQKSNLFYVGLVFTFILSWCVEWLGVHTGLIFGSYYYGPTLGIQLDGIPIIIGLNWCVMLIYSQHVATKFLPQGNRLQIALLAGAHMTLLDLVMEYCAPKLGFWQFTGSSHELVPYAPIQNFVGWFVVASALSYTTQLWYTESTDNRKLFFAFVNWIFFAALALGFLLQ
jgi:putative membrane protein